MSTTLLALPGSTRGRSFNRALARAAADLAPDGVTVEIGSIASIPLYDGDREREHGVPDAVKALKARVVATDGLLIVTPEYNHSVPGVLKNAIDWLSRPPKDIARVFHDRPVGVIGATPGRGGTRFAQTALLPTLRALGTRPWFGEQLYVARAREVFDDDGDLVDPKIRELLEGYVAGFAEHVRATVGGGR